MIAEDVLAKIREHAAAEQPRECCGLVLVFKGRQLYKPCRNMAEGKTHFVMNPEDYAAAEEMGTVLAVAHSHVYLTPDPSQADLVGCEKSGLPWVIVNYPVGHYVEISPKGYKAPYVGRNFHHGILDCYSLIKDYYEGELKIELPDFERPDQWWEKGLNLYLDGFESAGFVKVDKMQVNDVLLLKIGSPVPSHGAILVRDNVILHHFYGRLSSEDVYGGWWRQNTTHILRHRKFV